MKKSEWKAGDLAVLDGVLSVIESKTLTPVDGKPGFWLRDLTTGRRKARHPGQFRKPNNAEKAA